VAGKLAYRGFLNAVTPGRLVHVLDQISNRRFLVDTGASYSIFPHRSSAPSSGPRLSGPSGSHIPCWGEKELTLSFCGRRYLWTFLLADVQFPILGVDFLRHHHLLVDPAANRLVASVSASPQLSPSPSSPASAVANVKEPSGSLATVLQAGISCSSPSASASAVANVKAPSGSLATAWKAGQQSSSSAPVTAGSICSTSSTWCQQLLSEFADVVNPSKQLPILPETTDVLHHIKTSGPPISSKFRRLDGEKLAAAKAEFAQLEKEGIVRRSDSPWSSPLHMVEKADGTY
jgi:hypothetical protein